MLKGALVGLGAKGADGGLEEQAGGVRKDSLQLFAGAQTLCPRSP